MYSKKSLCLVSFAVVFIAAGGFSAAAAETTSLEIEIAGEKYQFVWCPPGETALDAHPVWRQESRVLRSGGFWIARYELTQKQWSAVTGRTVQQFIKDEVAKGRRVHHQKSPVLTEQSIGDEKPMFMLDYGTALAFIEKANLAIRHESKVLRLPNFVEWEYACRAGEAGPWPYGNKVDVRHANLLLERVNPGDLSVRFPGYFSEAPKATSGWDFAAPLWKVGSGAPNKWGIFDMIGNAEEIVESEEENARTQKLTVVAGETVMSPAHLNSVSHFSWMVPKRDEQRVSSFATIRLLMEQQATAKTPSKKN